MRGMSEEELREVAAAYFGAGPTINPESITMKVIDAKPNEYDVKIKWEEHIGAKSGVARLSDHDILYHLGLPCTSENLKKAIAVMKGVAYREKAHLIMIDDGRYLLINPKYRR